MKVQPDGSIDVSSLPKATDTLEPLSGLPIGSISLSGTAVKSLEPLRGMMLTAFEQNALALGDAAHVSDLAPLRGIPLRKIVCYNSAATELTPLAGMPLQILILSGGELQDISPLRDLPLEQLNGIAKIVDFSLLRAAPLKELRMSQNQCSDLSFLADSPALERLECNGNHIADLTPLRGKPIKLLNAERNRISDLRPLAGLPLTELIIHTNPIADYAPLRELRQLQKLRISDPTNSKVTLEPLRQHPSLQYIAPSWNAPYRPVAEFWADYDALHAAGKK